MLLKNYKAYFENQSNVIHGHELKGCGRVIMLISVGQNYHEAEKLLATIELINGSRFSKCTIVVADTLQRYNYYHAMSVERAHQFSLRQGGSWIKRNISIIKQLSIAYEIVRWDECLNHSSYSFFQTIIMKEYATNEIFQDSLNLTINEFIKRKIKRNEVHDIGLARQYCFDYIFEEAPIIIPMWSSLEYGAIIYPRPMTKITSHIAQIMNSKINWFSLRFKKKTPIIVEEEHMHLSQNCNLMPKSQLLRLQ